MSNEAERASVLIVEDDEAVGTVLVALLAQHAFDALHVTSAEEALRVLEKRPFDAVISDVRMPGMDGVALLKVLGQRFPELPVVLLTAHGSVPLAVEAMKAGAVDFMLKPFDRDEILFVLQKAIARGERATGHAPSDSEMIGAAASMKDVHKAIGKLASSDATVLVRGETGTGKELVARALHRTGSRKDHPFVVVHCAALPEALLESELFGHEKGAFTGASTRKPGRIELAHKGTVFLDEIGEVPLHVQVKLLRVLQERTFERVGGTQTLQVDVRFVAATHRDLEAMVEKGEFREDLFYRLNVVPIRVPSLRERAEDIETLATHFARALAQRHAKGTMTFDAPALAALRAHPWPGNVRQLQNFVERMVVLADETTLSLQDVERELASGAGAAPSADNVTMDAHRHEAEKEALHKALARAGNNRTLAARLLHVSRRTLYNKLREHGID